MIFIFIHSAIKINIKFSLTNHIRTFLTANNSENNWKKIIQNLYINYFIYRKLFPYIQLIAERCYIQELDKRCTKFLLQNVMYKFLYIVCLLGPNAILVFYFSIESLTDSFSISLRSIFFFLILDWVGLL